MKSSKDLENNLLTELKPASWELLRLKYLFKEINERSERGDEDLLTVSQFTGVTKTSESVGDDELVTNAETLEGYKKVSKNDLVFNIMLAWNGSLGIADTDGIVSPAYCVYRLRHNDNPKYFHYLFRTNLFKGLFKINSTGVVDSRLRLYPDKFFALPSLHPPRKEQDAIVKFLDEKIADIDKYISAKQKLIELLNEQKAAIINQAVTKGIDPNGKMKDSGDKYIGNIPDDWDVRKLKFLAEVIFSNVDKHSFEGELSVFLCNYVDVYKNDFITVGLDFMKATASKSETEKFVVKDGDIIITKDSETFEDIAKPALVIEQLENVICGYHLAIIRVKSERVTIKYLFYLFNSIEFNKQFAIRANGITRYGLSQSAVKDAKVLIPSIEEQKEIVALIEEKIKIIANQIKFIQQQINVIKDYKNSLIAEAVTGKLKIT